jgi:hypothetical protein
MQVSKIAVSNQFSTNKNQKSPAFGDKITVLTHKCPDIQGTMSKLREQTGIPNGLGIVIGDVTSALVTDDRNAAKKLAEYFVSLTSDLKHRLGLGYEGDALAPMMTARNIHLSNATRSSQPPIPAQQHFPIAEFIPKWPNAHG